MPLLNITHHPHSGWSPSQLQAAKRYGEIIDMPFPKVKPMATTNEIETQAQRIFFKILELQVMLEGELTVHIMGEMTLTYAILRLLREEGIRSLASTSERKVTQNKDNTRLVEFQFRQFRPYY